MSLSSSCSEASQDSTDAFIETLDLAAIETLALAVRRGSHEHGREDRPPKLLPPDLSCTLISPPKSGSFNVVYELRFSDAVRWAIRIPIHEWNDVRTRSMQLDILAQQYIASHSTVPIPAIHAYALHTDNEIGHPYTITEFARGVRLVDVWNEPSWWTGERRKERLLASLAAHMVSLASLEFDRIGRLGRGVDGEYFVAPFPSRLSLNEDLEGPDEELGPFDSQRAYLGTLLHERRRRRDSAMLAGLAVMLASLPDAQYDRAPFVLGHPDYDSQNVFVDEQTAEISAIIDWDGVAVVPRQLGALTYPAWLTVDWDPIMYPSYQEQPHHDSETDLHRYRCMYADAVGVLSQQQAAVTRNSHVMSALANAVTAEYTTAAIVYHLGKFMFGSSRLTFELLEGIEHASWFNAGSEDVAQVREWDKYKDEEEELQENGDNHQDFRSESQEHSWCEDCS